MKEFAVYSENSKKGLQIISLLEEYFDLKGVLIHDQVQMIRTLEELTNPVVLMQFEEGVEMDDSIRDYLLSKEFEIVCEAKDISILADIECKTVDSLFSLDSLERVLDDLGVKKKICNDHGFSKIQLFNCFQMNIAPTDIFLKLNENHYVKIIKEGDLFTSELLSKYLYKNVRYFYVKCSDSSRYFDEVGEMLLDMYNEEIRPSLPHEDEVHIASMRHIMEMARTIGLKESVIQLADKLISSVCGSLRETPAIKHIIDSIFLKDSELARHSLSVGMIACAIAENLDWQSEHTMKKLVTASMLHDLSLKNNYFVTIDSIQSEVFENLSDIDQQHVLEHPILSSELVKNLEGVTANIDTIIRQHHERPQGEGFPRGLNANQIAPLSCIFILAEDFYNQLIRHGNDKKTISLILKEMGEIYNEGNFKKPFSSLVNCFFS